MTSKVEQKNIIHTYTCLSSTTWKANLVVKDFFCFILISRSLGISKYQFLKKIYDGVNKVCMFKFEKLSIFIAFPLPSREMGTNSLIFQSDQTGG